jgi:hypothetical protein
LSKEIEELKHWVWATQKAIGEYCERLNVVMNMDPALGMPDIHMQQLNSETEAKVHVVVNSADHMFKAAKLAQIKEAIVDDSLKKLVHNLRNLREHWDQNKKYFENPELEIPKERNTASARWFKKHFPDSTPWSGGWTNLCGYTAGPLYLGQLFEQANRLLFVIEAAEK